MKRLNQKPSKKILLSVPLAIIMLLALSISCIPEGTSAPAGGFASIESISAQVTAEGTPQPTVTPMQGNGNQTPGGGATVTPGATPTATTPGASPTATPAPAGSDVTISIETANFEIVDKLGQPAEPGEGHVHFFLDAVPPIQQRVPAVSAPGTYVALAANSYTWPDVPPGLHILSAELANNDHTPIAPPVVASVMVWIPDETSADNPQITSIEAQIMEAGTAPEATMMPKATASPTATVAPVPGAADIMVSIQTANFKIADKLDQPAVEGEGHIHYFLDAIPPTFPGQVSVTSGNTYALSLETTYTWSGVLPGVHILTAELVNNDHTALNPPVLAAAAITVMPSGEAVASPTTAPSPTGTMAPTSSPTMPAVPPPAGTVTGTPTATTSPTGTAPAGGGTTIDLVAQANAFNTESISVPAGAQVTINFNNMDSGIPHNFAVYDSNAAEEEIFVGEIITGPATTTYTFTAPDTPGTYFFRCDVHPTTMTGDLIVQ